MTFKWGLLFLSAFFLSPLCLAETKYTETIAPPSVGWESALKFFSRSPSSTPNSSYYGDSAFQLDQSFFVNNQYVSEGLSSPRWGINLGYEWDQSWYGSGIYLNYVDFQQALKYSVTGGFYYPRLESGFPLYIRAHIGLGYYSNDFETKGVTFDYNAGLGLRFFSGNNWLFNLEVGSRNHTLILNSESAESIVVGSGVAITF